MVYDLLVDAWGGIVPQYPECISNIIVGEGSMLLSIKPSKDRLVINDINNVTESMKALFGALNPVRILVFKADFTLLIRVKLLQAWENAEDREFIYILVKLCFSLFSSFTTSINLLYD